MKKAAWHGTLKGYDGHRCRCAPCSDAKSAVNKVRYEDFKRWLSVVKNQPCTDCKLSYPSVCMDFAYRDAATKKFDISSGAMRQRAFVMREIAKCDVVCANCNRLRSDERRQSATGEQ